LAAQTKQPYPRSHCKGMPFRSGFHSAQSTNSSYLLTTEESCQVNPFSLLEPGTLQGYLMEKQQGFRGAYGVADLLAPSSGSPTQKKIISFFFFFFFFLQGDNHLSLKFLTPAPGAEDLRSPTHLQPDSNIHKRGSAIFPGKSSWCQFHGFPLPSQIPAGDATPSGFDRGRDEGGCSATEKRGGMATQHNSKTHGQKEHRGSTRKKRY